MSLKPPHEKIRDSSASRVLSWLTKLYGIPATGEETVEELLEKDVEGFPQGLRYAYYIQDRFPVRQNVWSLTPASKLTKIIRAAWIDEGKPIGDGVYLLMEDSTLSGADSLLLIRATVTNADTTFKSYMLESWGLTKGKSPSVIIGGCVLPSKVESLLLTVEALQLSTAKYV